MGKLMKYDRCEFDIVPTHHGVEHGVVEVSQRGIRRYAADRDVESPAMQRLSKAAGLAFGEIAAIGDAADNGITPLLGVDREFRRSDHIPNHVGAPEIRVTAVAAVIRQSEFAAGEIANRGDRLELGPKRRGSRWLVDHAVDRF